MYVTEVYQMLQAAIRQHHKQFPFPKADFNEASEKIKLVVGEFTKDLNEVLREKERERANAAQESRDNLELHYMEKLDKASSSAFTGWILFGISLAINIYFIFIA